MDQARNPSPSFVDRGPAAPQAADKLLHDRYVAKAMAVVQVVAR